MAKLSELINQYTVTIDSTLTALSPDEVRVYGEQGQKWLVVVTTTSGRSITVPFFYPKTHVVKPADNKYHPRYGADISIEPPSGPGAVLSDDWWYRYGQPVKPRVDEVASKCANLVFLMSGIADFEGYCEQLGLNNDSIKALAAYNEAVALVAAITVFLADTYDLFVNAEVDI